MFPIWISNIYYGLAFLAFLWMAKQYRSNSLLMFLLVMAFEGTMVYWLPGITAQKMRIIYVVWIICLIIKEKAWSLIKGKLQVLIWTFVLFSVYFIWVSLYMNDDPFLMTFSQYSMYFTPLAVMFVMGVYFRKSPSSLIVFNNFWGQIILIQILSAIIKYCLLGFHHWEGMVGTFGPLKGGGAGTSFPLVALAWVLVNSNMDIRGWKSWLFIAGLLLIGIATGKRAVVVLYPAFFLLFAMYVARKRYKRGVVAIIALVPLLFYFGLRLTPTFNPEHKVWGSFDPEFALHYAENYSMGKENRYGERGEGNGRIGANRLFFQRIMDVDHYTKESWFGNGLKRIFVSDIERYDDRKYNFGVNSRGSLTGFAMMYLSVGVVGLVLFMLYYWFYFTIIKYWRLRLSLYGLVMFDFIFYNWHSIRDSFLAVTLIFVMYYSLMQYTPSGKFMGWKHKFFN